MGFEMSKSAGASHTTSLLWPYIAMQGQGSGL